MELQLTLKEVFMFGGLLIVIGGLVATVTVNRGSISRLWDLKQEKAVCEPTHDAIKEDIKEIKGDVRWLVQDRKENGG